MDILNRQSELHQFVFDSAFEASLIINKEGVIKSMNRAWNDHLIYDGKKDQYLNQSYKEYYKDQKELLVGIDHVLEAKEVIYNQKLVIREHSFLIRISPIKNFEYEIVGALIVYIDMTEQYNLEEIFKNGAKEFRLIAEHSKDMIKLTDTEGNVEYASPSHEAILGYIDQSNIYDYIHPEDALWAKQIRNEVIDLKESRQMELRKKNKNGEWIWVESVCSPVFSNDGNVRKMVFITRDITERKQMLDELERMAYFDFLTELYNRRKLRMIMEDTIEESARSGEQFAILIMDLDKFKLINDTHGHDIGDRVLKEFANRLISCKREVDIAGRLGGDEFSVVMKGIKGKEDVLRFIRRLQYALLEPYFIPHLTSAIQIKASAGYAIYPNHGTSIISLMKVADNALYKEKRMPFKGAIISLLQKTR